MFLISTDGSDTVRAEAVTCFSIHDPDKDGDCGLLAGFAETYQNEKGKPVVLGYYLMYHPSRLLCEAVRDEIINLMSTRPSTAIVKVSELVSRLEKEICSGTGENKRTSERETPEA